MEGDKVGEGTAVHAAGAEGGTGVSSQDIIKVAHATSLSCSREGCGRPRSEPLGCLAHPEGNMVCGENDETTGMVLGLIPVS